MSETPKIKLPKIAGNMTWDVVRDLNALADAVDSKAGAAGGLATLGINGKVPAEQVDVDTSNLATKTELTAHVAEKATLTTEGHVQLSNSTTSTSNTLAATPSAVKQAMDKANEAFTLGNSRKEELVDLLLSLDDSLPINYESSWEDILLASENISTGKKSADGVGDATEVGSFRTESGSNTTAYKLSVTGLDFIPRAIIVYRAGGIPSFSIDTEAPKYSNYSISNGVTTNRYRLGQNEFVIEHGAFTIPADNASQTNLHWVAYE